MNDVQSCRIFKKNLFLQLWIFTANADCDTQLRNQPMLIFHPKIWAYETYLYIFASDNKCFSGNG